MRAGTLVFLAAVLAARPSYGATIDAVLVEAYTGPRPLPASDILQPLISELTERGVVAGERLSDELSDLSRAGMSVSSELVKHLGRLVDVGHSSLNTGDYAAAGSRLTRAIEVARASTALLSKEDSLRKITLHALLGLTMVLQREADQAASESRKLDRAGKRTDAALKRQEEGKARELAEAMIEEAIRSFPTVEPDPDEYGTDILLWWRKARQKLQKAGTGTLVIDPGDDGVTVWINEAFAGVGVTTKGDLLPGRYRVYTQRAADIGRVHLVDVVPRQITHHTIDWRFDTALRTGAYVGFSFKSAQDHRELRASYAARVAKAAGAKEAIVVGLSSQDGAQLAFGLRVDGEGRVITAGQVLLGRADSAANLHALALLLTGQRQDVDGLQRLGDPLPWVDQRPEPAVHPRGAAADAAQTPRAWPAWTAAGLSGAALTAGIIWSVTDSDCVASQTDPCARIRTTKTEAIVASSTGIVLGAATGYLWGRHRRAQRRLVRGRWVWITGAASVGAVAAGTTLMAMGSRMYQLGEDDTNNGLKPYRSTLLLGGCITAVGAVGLGFSVYSATGRAESVSLMPTVSVGADSAAVGVAGRF
jgi:hypothetical protein